MPTVMRLSLIDCQGAGIAGDMFLGALLDLGADSNKVLSTIESLRDYIDGCKSVEIDVCDVKRNGLRAKKINITTESPPQLKGEQLKKIITRSLANGMLSTKAKHFAQNVVHTLLEAEAKIHKENINSIHLHETGLIDTPAEIVGSTVALEDLGFFDNTMKVYSTPVAVGGGLLSFSHGTVSVPAPATIEILRSKQFPFVGGPVESELATPTGVSLLVNLVNEIVSFSPLIKPLKVGYGAGMKDLPKIPNILRVLMGDPVDYNFIRDDIVVVETNLDDITGEVLGYTIDKLVAEGAKDVSVIPMVTKKSRPGYIIKMISDRETVEQLSRILIEETGSLGVRIHPCERRILIRKTKTKKILLRGIKEIVRVKVAQDSKGRIIQIKPEYDDLQRIAKKTGKSLRELRNMINKQTK